MNKLICYTDGSCIPNPGVSGYGIHAVLIDDDIKPKQIQGKYKLTDHGYLTKTEIKTRESVIEKGFSHTYDIYGFDKNSITNNQAELDAIIEAIKYTLTVYKDLAIEDLLILSDSNYSLGVINKLLNDELTLDDSTKNLKHITTLKILLKEVKDVITINFDKVPAHSTNLGNNRADMLANMGRILSLRNEKIKINKLKQDDKDTWKEPNIDKDMFYFKQILSFMDIGNNFYFGLNYKDVSDIGKKTPYVTYTIVNRKHDEVIDNVMNKVKEALGNKDVPFIVRLNELYNKDVIKDYIKFGNDFIEVKSNNYKKLVTVNGFEIARELFPPGLTVLAIDRFRDLNFNLQGFILGDKLPNETVLDITDSIYDYDDKKDKLFIKKDMINDKFTIKLKQDKTPIHIKPKYDLPPRNTLKRLEKEKPRVSLIIKDHGGLLEYYTILSTRDGDILTSNIFSNKVVKKV